MQKPSLSIVIPCYNERDSIVHMARMLDSFRQENNRREIFSSIEAIVVDDGSTDYCHQMIDWPQTTLLRHPERRGYGAALKTGFSQATGELLSFLDMDASYDPSDLFKMYEKMLRDDAKVVFGCRFQAQSGMPWTRYIGNMMFSGLLKILLRSPVTDVCTGLRLFQRSSLSFVRNVPQSDLSFSIALTAALVQSKMKLSEIPVNYYTRQGFSKLNIFVDGFLFLAAVIRIPSKVTTSVKSKYN
jgi:glycosyltransferase involved in cell wall biosynthesis